MINLPAALISEKNKLGTGTWSHLAKIVLSDATEYLLTSNNEDVSFGGDTYTAYPMKFGDFSESSRGELFTYKLQIANITGEIINKIESLDGGKGSTIEVTFVNLDNLAADYSDLVISGDLLSLSFDSRIIYITFGLANLRRVKTPKYTYLANNCNWAFKDVECAYAGVETLCNRTFKRCLELSNTPRFGGHRGLQEDSIRILR